jgi:hypothetical protein
VGVTIWQCDVFPLFLFSVMWMKPFGKVMFSLFGKASHCQMVTPTKLRNEKEGKHHIAKWLHPYNCEAKKKENITLPNGYTHIPKKRKRGNTSHCQIGCNHLAM